MKKLKISDAVSGHLHISKGKNKYFKTKDSASPSGHSLLAQIDMTHSGIVTRNYGFYLPARMKQGAASFTKDYNKPLLRGHDESDESKPVGRVINAEYIDNSGHYKQTDSYLNDLFRFQDKDSEKASMLDFCNHVIRNYDGKDGYKGLGHLRGTVKVTDPDVIQGILDETYLTVSTSMISDSATCNICGTDWVSEGLCDHSRGQSYDDNVCVVIPGSMFYDHLGIVNTPADPHAHDFTIISDNPSEAMILQLDNKDSLYKTKEYEAAAELFAYQDKSIIPLSSDKDINLLEIKDNITKMENMMKNKKTQKKSLDERIKDEMTVSMNVYRWGSEEHGSKEVSVREMMSELSEDELMKMVQGIAGMMETEDSVSDEDVKNAVNKYFSDNYEVVETPSDPAQNNDNVDNDTEEGFFGEIIYGDETVHKGAEDASDYKKKKKRSKKKSKKMNDAFKLEDVAEIEVDAIKEEVEGISAVKDHNLDNEAVVELAEHIALFKAGDALAVATFNWTDKTHEEIVLDYKAWKDSLIEFDDKSGDEIYEEMKALLAEDALSEEDYGNLKASDYCGVRGYFPVVDEAHAKAALKVLSKCKLADSVKGRILCAIHRKASRMELDLSDNFDSDTEPCNNNDSVTREEAIKAFEDAKTKLEEMGIEVPELQVEDASDKDQEIEILEAQLDAANEELDSLSAEVKDLKLKLGEQLATRSVDMKMLSGGFEIEDRVKAIEDHKSRSIESLEDGIKDLETQFKIADFKVSGGMAQAPNSTVEDPTLKQEDKKAKTSKEEEEDTTLKLYDEYNLKVATYGKRIADRWLARVQKENGSLPTID